LPLQLLVWLVLCPPFSPSLFSFFCYVFCNFVLFDGVGVCFSYYNVYNFLFRARRVHAGSDKSVLLASSVPHAHSLSLWHPVATLSPFVVIWGGALLWAVMSPSQILASHTRTFLFAHGFLFCSFVCRLMLAHLSLQPAATAVHWALVPGVLAIVNAIVLDKPYIDEAVRYMFAFCHGSFDVFSLFLCILAQTSVLILLAFAFLLWLHLVIVASGEIATALGINILTLTQKQLDADAKQVADAAASKKQ
jgi:hypothetical protein